MIKLGQIFQLILPEGTNFIRNQGIRYRPIYLGIVCEILNNDQYGVDSLIPGDNYTTVINEDDLINFYTELPERFNKIRYDGFLFDNNWYVQVTEKSLRRIK